MKLSLAFARTLFSLLSVIFMVSFAIATFPETAPYNFLLGLALGAITIALLLVLERLFKRFSLRAFNTTLMGLFVGSLMGFALVTLFNGVASSLSVSPPLLGGVRVFLLLVGAYLGVVLTIRNANTFYLSVPFFRFQPSTEVSPDLIVDRLGLADGRMIELASTGLLNHRLVVPRFLLKDLDTPAQSNLKKLESLPNLNLSFDDTPFSEVSDEREKIIRLAHIHNAQVITCRTNPIELSESEGIRFLNLQSLACALKPLQQKGETLEIKIQRLGKEEMQGVGYLEDGTMVVVNGGGDYIGEMVRARVLSVKHSSTGRMIFCNAETEEVCA